MNLQYLLATLLTFSGSFLLFVVQPFAAKTMLPLFGGTQSVWTAAMLFFQFFLFCGYSATLFLTKLEKPFLKKYLFLLASLSLLALFLVTYRETDIGIEEFPELSAFIFLALYIGIPYFLLSLLAPLIQFWCKNQGVENPYILYRASNFGSFLALFCYPFIFEKTLTLEIQYQYWRYAVVTLFVLVNLWGILTYKNVANKNSEVLTKSVPKSRICTWIILSFLPSCALLGATNHLTTNILPFPLLWIFPLALYLVSFIISFSDYGSIFTSRIYAFVAIPTLLSVILGMDSPIWFCILLHSILLLALSIYCHSKLYQLRPDASLLGFFYLAVSFGGMCGGIFNTLIAPRIFNEFYEYPIAICLALLLTGLSEQIPRKVLTVFLLSLLASAVFVLLNPTDYIAIPLAITAIVAFYYRREASICGAILLGMWCSSLLRSSNKDTVTTRYRNFFGTFNVAVTADQKYRKFVHGITVHGVEDIAGDECIPRAYFHQRGPSGDILRSRNLITDRQRNIIVLGLGIGSLFCYAENDEDWTSVEINPLVLESALNDFKTLARSKAKSIKHIIDDGRKAIEKMSDSKFDIIFVDAFSSDAIPTHLITIEAVKVYLSRLANDGIVVFQISNRFCDLKPIIARIASILNLNMLFKDDLVITKQDDLDGKGASQWAMITKNEAVVNNLKSAGWQLGKSDNKRSWSDNFTNIAEILRW